MFENIQLKFGSSPSAPKLEFKPTPLTIFVGPNNSGKSQILREINYFYRENISRYVIVNKIVYSSVSNVEEEIKKHTIEPGHRRVRDGHILFGNKDEKNEVEPEMLKRLFSNPNLQPQQFAKLFLAPNTLSLNGMNRLSIIIRQGIGDLNQPRNSFDVLLTNDDKRLEIRRILYDAFKKYFTLDPTSNRAFIKFSETEPSILIERSFTDEALKYHRNNLSIDSMSDGVKAFTGIILSLVAYDPKVILLDEPEAFLHPSLSFKLGKELGNILIKDNSKRVFVGTHSANFLMGCIQSGVPLNIVRLTYSNNQPAARVLESTKVSKLMRHPLLRSVHALNGLFYDYVVVTESDADRAFYQEINDRLLAFLPEKGIPHCLFLNAQNKQTIHEIVKPLREMGIPCAGIVDIDVIKEGGAIWANLTNCGFLPEVTRRETEISRSSLKTKFDKTGLDFKRNGGVSVLNEADQEACNNLFDRLDEYGIFVVRNGELESWLKHLGATGHSPKWLIEIFEQMGEDPNSEKYVKPTEGDVWEFISKIKSWFVNPNRKGIPD